MGFGNMGGRMGGGKLIIVYDHLLLSTLELGFKTLFVGFRNGQLWRSEQLGSFWLFRDGTNER